jgi:hypothetical protein
VEAHMANLWIKIIKNNRIAKSDVAPLVDSVQEALAEKLREMDLPSPLWLSKHENEMEKFFLTSFLAGDFIEPVKFDRLDISVFDEHTGKRANKDPRNEF